MIVLFLAAALAAPDVVLISVDTLRADRLGCYGYESNTSPNLDKFAQSALVFEDMVCEVPLTNPSFCAMMASQYPRSTGVTRNGLKLPKDIPTVAQHFKAAGYQTVCVQSNWTLKAKLSGLDRGFDIYNDDFEEKRWGLMKGERDGKLVAGIALELLASRKPGQPLFAWFHFSDPHAPYDLHEEFDVSDSAPIPGRKAQRVSIAYDSEVAYTDFHVARVLEALPEDTVVVFLGDHGESLYEHDYLGHGRRIYQVGLHIPFIVRSPSVAPGRNALPARGIDVGPTLLALAGIAVPPEMLGIDLLANNIPKDRVRVVETYGGAIPRLPGAKALMSNRPPLRQGVLHQGWKLIVGGKGPELFELASDPGERNNLSSLHPGRIERMRLLIAEWDAAVATLAGEEAPLSDEDIEALESLGYTN